MNLSASRRGTITGQVPTSPPTAVSRNARGPWTTTFAPAFSAAGPIPLTARQRRGSSMIWSKTTTSRAPAFSASSTSAATISGCVSAPSSGVLSQEMLGFRATRSPLATKRPIPPIASTAARARAPGEEPLARAIAGREGAGGTEKERRPGAASDAARSHFEEGRSANPAARRALHERNWRLFIVSPAGGCARKARRGRRLASRAGISLAPSPRPPSPRGRARDPSRARARVPRRSAP